MSKTRNRRIAKAGEGVIGVDIGKYNHVAVVQNWEGRRLKPLVFSNTRDGFNKLWAYQQEAKKYLEIKEIRIGFEPTGHYWESLAQWANQSGFGIDMVNPAHTYRAKELEDNSPGKTDIKDAGVIADLCLQGKTLKLVMPQGSFAEIRYLTKYRQELVKDHTRIITRIHQAMDILFPELIGLFRKNIGKGLVKLLKETGTPEKILQKGEEGIKQLLAKHSQGRLGIKRAGEIIEAANKSVGIKRGVKAVEFRLKQLLNQLDNNENEIKLIEWEIKKVLYKIPYACNLLTIPNIGEIGLAAILGETGDVKNYASAKQLIKLAGLNLYEISSGQHRGRKRITKRGRPFLRQMLYLACLRMIRAKSGFYIFYKRLVDKGTAKIPAIIAMMCKLLKVIFAITRDNKIFNNKKIEGATAVIKAA